MTPINPTATYSLSEIKERPGWTDASVKRFLGEPDEFKVNPMYKSASPMRLYVGARIAKAEGSEEFEVWKIKSLARSARARQRADVKRQELLAWIDGLDVRIKKVKDLEKKAIEAYNEMQFERGSWKGASSRAPREFLDRITVNYLRHECSRYEDELDNLFGQVGCAQGYLRLKEKVLRAISSTYPSLQDEVERQVVLMHQEVRW